MIRFDHVTKVYPTSTRPALDDVSFTIDDGDFVFLIGPSGSGKSTFLQLMIREENVTSGDIWFGDFHVNALGGKVTELADGLHIDPAPLHGGEWPCYADHRMATAGAIIGLRVPGVEIEDISTTAKTLPGFDRMWETMVDPEQQESNG